MIHLALDLPATHLPSLAVGVGGLLLLALGERLLPGRPVALVVVLLSIVLMSLTGLAAAGVKVVGDIGGGIAVIDLRRLTLADLRAVLPMAIACFLLAYVESISVVRSFALKHGYATDADREMLALGAANLAAGLGQGFPVGGGMSQSAVNEKGGAQTPASLLVAALVIAVVVLFLTGLFRNLPEPILAAVVLMAIKGLVDIGELRHLYRVSRLEFHVALVATVGVLLFGILNGVLLAAIAAIVLIVKRAARPYTAELGRVPGTNVFSDIARNPGHERVPGALIARIEGILLYFNVEYVRSELMRRVESQQPPVSLVVLDLSGVARHRYGRRSPAGAARRPCSRHAASPSGSPRSAAWCATGSRAEGLADRLRHRRPRPERGRDHRRHPCMNRYRFRLKSARRVLSDLSGRSFTKDSNVIYLTQEKPTVGYHIVPAARSRCSMRTAFPNTSCCV